MELPLARCCLYTLFISYTLSLQKLQPAGNTIHLALWRGPNTKNSQTPTLNLCPPRIGNHLSRNPQAPRRPLQQQKLLLTLDLNRNLGLPAPLPRLEDLCRLSVWVFGGSFAQRLVASQRCVASLGSNFPYFFLILSITPTPLYQA